LFLVYRASLLPNPLRSAEIWRKEARKAGVGEIFLCRVESFSDEITDPTTIGFDAAVEFQPDWTNLCAPIYEGNRWQMWWEKHTSGQLTYVNKRFDYATVVKNMIAKPQPAYPRFPCVMPFWDNSARRETDAWIFVDSTPSVYEDWLRKCVGKSKAQFGEDALVFINAWNEWGEGCHLEPCQRYGRSYLEATRRALDENR
jgi:hypothetical protein